MNRPLDAIFVYASIGPHIAAWMKSMAKVRSIGVIAISSLHGVYGWQNADELEGIPYHILTQDMDAEKAARDEPVIQKGIEILRRERPAYLLQARYDLPFTRNLCSAAHSFGTKNVLMSDSWEGVGKRWRVKEMLKARMLQSKFDGAMIAGSRSFEYALKLGFRSSQVGWLIDVVDNKYFQRRRAEAFAQEALLRETFDLPKEYFLVIARHSPEKNLRRLLTAYASYRDGGGSTPLIFLGSGPETELLKEDCRRLGIEPFVSFRGWVNYQHTPVYLALARALLLVSTEEPWGLAVNEALASQIPVIVSTTVGCSTDLVRHGWNGWLVPPADLDGMRYAMDRIDKSTAAEREEMGRRGAAIVADYSLENRSLNIDQLLSRMASK